MQSIEVSNKWKYLVYTYSVHIYTDASNIISVIISNTEKSLECIFDHIWLLASRLSKVINFNYQIETERHIIKIYNKDYKRQYVLL